MKDKSYKIHTPKAKDFIVTAIGAMLIMGALTIISVFLARLF